MKIVCTSGFFDNVHCGHLDSFKSAKEHGDYLLVFVDSDRKAILKKGFVIMPEKEWEKNSKIWQTINEKNIELKGNYFKHLL